VTEIVCKGASGDSFYGPKSLKRRSKPVHWTIILFNSLNNLPTQNKSKV